MAGSYTIKYADEQTRLERKNEMEAVLKAMLGLGQPVQVTISVADRADSDLSAPTPPPVTATRQPRQRPESQPGKKISKTLWVDRSKILWIKFDEAELDIKKNWASLLRGTIDQFMENHTVEDIMRLELTGIHKEPSGNPNQKAMPDHDLWVDGLSSYAIWLRVQRLCTAMEVTLELGVSKNGKERILRAGQAAL